MLLVDIRKDLLRKLGVETPSDAPAYVDEDVLTAINLAGQVLNTAGDPFWLTDEVIVTVDGSTKTKVIDGHSVKTARISATNLPLLRAESLWQLEQYHSIYLGDATPAASYAPQAYFVDTTSAADALVVTVHFGPRPMVSTELKIVYVPKFVNWVLADINSGTKKPEIPFDYIESTFLPIARYYATRSHWFSRSDMMPAIERDFASAVQVLQSANPALHVPYADQLRKEAPAR
jgi:hypothetical protein